MQKSDLVCIYLLLLYLNFFSLQQTRLLFRRLYIMTVCYFLTITLNIYSLLCSTLHLLHLLYIYVCSVDFWAELSIYYYKFTFFYIFKLKIYKIILWTMLNGRRFSWTISVHMIILVIYWFIFCIINNNFF